MGLNFRGQANRFSELKKNKAGFQEKSAPGPRQGIGGDEPGNLKAAEARFGNIVSPTKIKKFDIKIAPVIFHEKVFRKILILWLKKCSKLCESVKNGFLIKN